ncbi:hypothetical protein TL16_g04693 [Triparma laevis f. inornata]|uniref:DUF389 domain-containing protein n=2 Tax=Triparma laevis TaxID=1534972 RepID=A0A9W7KXI7_9STRA|nr:hypothetical protein TL16_g04693 [Triparma laevis f. inornata]GMI14841.1 hypothetical protein TrLO_g12319 [Triparma laevis f. longispina]
MKLFQLTIPNPKVPQFLSLLETEFGLGDNLMTMASFKSTLIQFRVDDDHVHFVLTELQALGLGISFGFCDVLDLKASTTVPAKALRSQEAIQSTSHLAPSQIYSNIVKKAVLTIDTVIIIIMSAAMAGIGLAINNRIYIMAGSLLSRLMGPIMGASYGLAILDKELFTAGVRNLTIALSIIIGIGFLMGIAFAPFAETLLWPTDEMAIRGVYLEMMFGAIIAVCGGASVAVAESNEDLSSVAGIAISSALVPPAVNSGLCFAFLLVGNYFSDNEIDQSVFFRIATSSIFIVVINCFFIYSTAFVVFKMRSTNSKFLFKKSSKSHKKLEKKRRDSILLGTARMSDSPTKTR